MFFCINTAEELIFRSSYPTTERYIVLHELGVVIEVVKTVESFAEKNCVKKINAITLQIGEISSMIPKYIEDCYPAAVEGTILRNAQLKIETLPANGLCRICSRVYNLVENKSLCPGCGGRDFEILSGKEFIIKEIIAC